MPPQSSLHITKSSKLVRDYISFSNTVNYHRLPNILIIFCNHPLPPLKRHGALMNSKWFAHGVALDHNREDSHKSSASCSPMSSTQASMANSLNEHHTVMKAMFELRSVVLVNLKPKSSWKRFASMFNFIQR